MTTIERDKTFYAGMHARALQGTLCVPGRLDGKPTVDHPTWWAGFNYMSKRIEALVLETPLVGTAAFDVLINHAATLDGVEHEPVHHGVGTPQEEPGSRPD